ncbi:ATP-binding protein [Streptomyces sp. NPDC052682]|uniref:ATP-binding protein n=1 Tax=Streptomyces sp. NPDC052682 TaxID=3154954 RepID=UPI00341E98EF
MHLTDGTGPARSDGALDGRRTAGAEVPTAASARAHAESVVRARWEAAGRVPHEQDMIDLLIVVSELVTNAIVHGDGVAGFDVRTTEDGVRLDVHDHSDVIPEAAHGSGALPTGYHGSGYGWPLVIRLARDISVRRRPGGGKTVSVLMPLRDAPGPALGAAQA